MPENHEPLMTLPIADAHWLAALIDRFLYREAARDDEQPVIREHRRRLRHRIALAVLENDVTAPAADVPADLSAALDLVVSRAREAGAARRSEDTAENELGIALCHLRYHVQGMTQQIRQHEAQERLLAAQLAAARSDANNARGAAMMWESLAKPVEAPAVVEMDAADRIPDHDSTEQESAA